MLIMQNEEFQAKIVEDEVLPQEMEVPPTPPEGLRVYQDERGEVLSAPIRGSLAGALFLVVWLVFWWIGIAKQLHALLTTPQEFMGWIFFAIFCIPGVVVPFVILGMFLGVQELCFRFDGQVTYYRRRLFVRYAAKNFFPGDVQRLVVRQAPAYTKNRTRVNHLTPTSTLEIGLPGETLSLNFSGDPDQAIARYCGARIRVAQRTF